jgi:hypothetical protein
MQHPTDMLCSGANCPHFPAPRQRSGDGPLLSREREREEEATRTFFSLPLGEKGPIRRSCGEWEVRVGGAALGTAVWSRY